jgi:hypothetical protein
VSAKSSEYKVYQQSLPIHDGRYDVKHPVETSAPPVKLFEPAFAHFLDDVENDIPVDPEVAMATVSYMRAASGIYESEKLRKRAIAPFFRQIVGLGVDTVSNSDLTTPDGLIAIPRSGTIAESTVFFLEEQKRDSDEGDPSVQCGWSMARYWAQQEVNSESLQYCLV